MIKISKNITRIFKINENLNLHILRGYCPPERQTITNYIFDLYAYIPVPVECHYVSNAPHMGYI